MLLRARASSTVALAVRPTLRKSDVTGHVSSAGVEEMDQASGSACVVAAAVARAAASTGSRTLLLAW